MASSGTLQGWQQGEEEDGRVCLGGGYGVARVWGGDEDPQWLRRVRLPLYALRWQPKAKQAPSNSEQGRLGGAATPAAQRSPPYPPRLGAPRWVAVQVVWWPVVGGDVV
eukprot:EG_transcript_20610